ncbi:MAG: hypothetical protein AAF583_16780, partial [Pseudomonadota bacterium]
MKAECAPAASIAGLDRVLDKKPHRKIDGVSMFFGVQPADYRAIRYTTFVISAEMTSPVLAG